MDLTRVSLAINAVLAVAIGFLFLKVYGTPSQPVELENTDSTATVSLTKEKPLSPLVSKAKPGQGVYFVNTDTLLSRYTVFKKQKTILEGKSKRFEQDMAGRVRALEGELAEAQQKVQAGTLTQSQAQELEASFQQKQQALAQYRETQANKLMEEEKTMSAKLNEGIQSFLKGYASKKGYRYVLGYSVGGGILYANDSLDVTADVVKGLNASR